MSVKTLEMKMHMHTFLAWKLDPRVSALVESHVSVSGYESQNIKGTIMEHFKINEEKAESLMMNSGNSIDLSRLKFEFEMVPQEEDIDLEPYFKAYLLFLLGEFIHPNNSCSYSPMYLPLLGLNVVNHYAWGAAMLANMKESIEKVKKVGKFTSLCGFSYALTVFALERFPFLRERCGSSPLYSLPSGFPLILGWMEALCKPNKDTKNVKSVGYYKKKLQDMEEKDHRLCGSLITIVTLNCRRSMLLSCLWSFHAHHVRDLKNVRIIVQMYVLSN